MTSTTSSVRLLGIEDRLAADATGVERDRIIECLRALARDARSALDKGVTPSHAHDLRSLIVAVDAAETVVSRVWRQFHNRGR